jgi:hypothetical protein
VPQSHAQPRQQLRHAKRLGQVVIGASVQGQHFIALLLARRQDDDRRSRPTAQLADHL